MPGTERQRFYRDAGVALVFLLGLLALTRLDFTPVELPGYLVLLGFKAPMQTLVPGLRGGGEVVGFGGYLLGLAALSAAFAGRLRTRFGGDGRLRYGLAGAALALVTILLGAAVVITVPNLRQVPTPAVLATAAGLGGLWLGVRLAAARDGAG